MNGLSRGLALGLCVLVIASGFAPVFAATDASAASTSAASASPPGLVGIPDANVHEDLPPQASHGVNRSALLGSVMASRHASTLEVTVTTPGRAPSNMGAPGVSVGSSDGGLAIVLTDDVNSAGRSVALPQRAVKDALGYVPGIVQGTHESGERWTRPVRAESGLLVFQVPHFSSNTVTFDSEVVLTGDPATDGAQYAYSLDDLDAAGNASVEFTGSTATEWDNVTGGGLTNGDSLTLGVAGNLAPTGPSAGGEPTITLTGTGGDTPRTVTGTALSDGNTLSYTVGGNMAPTGPSANGEPTVTFTGRGDDTWANESGTGATGATNAQSITVNGNVDPTGPSVNDKPTLEIDASDASVRRGEPNSNTRYWDESHTTGGEICNPSPPETLTGVSFPDVFNQDGGVDVRVRVAQEAEADGIIKEGTVVAEQETFLDSAGDDTIEFDSPYSTGGNPICLSWEYAYGGSDGAEIWTDASPSQNLMSNNGTVRSEQVDAIWESKPTNVSVSADDGTAYTFGNLTGSGAVTAEFGLTKSATSLDFDGGGSMNWTLRKEHVNRTQDPSIDLDGDTTADASFTGVLSPGATSTVEVAGLAVGDGPGTVSTTAGSTVDVALDFTQRNRTQDPSIDVNGDGIADANHSGVLSPGSTVTTEVAGLAVGDGPAAVTTSSGSEVDVEVAFRERTQTVNPAVEVNGNTTSYLSSLADGESTTLTVDASSLQSGTNRVNVSVGDGTLTADSPTPRVGFRFNHTAASSQSVEVVGETWTDRYEVNKTWASNRSSASLVVPFAENIIAVREVRTGPDAGNLTTTSDYSLDGTTLTVNLGSVEAGETSVVQVNGSKVRVNNGSISVTSPTTAGNSLSTSFLVESKAPGFWIGVGGTASGADLHYVVNESWPAPSDYAIVRAGGTQRLHLPNAPEGGSATARALPLEVRPQTDANVSVLDPGKPKVELRPGETTGDEVTFRYRATTSGTTYGLYSQTRDDYLVDKATAQSPVDLTASSDGPEILYIAIFEDTSSSSGGGNAGGGGGGAPVQVQGNGLLRSPLVVGPLAVALILGAVLVARRTSLPLWAAGAASVVAALVAFESLAPGSVSGVFSRFGVAAAAGFGQVSSALLLVGGFVGLWGLYRVVKKFTRKEQVTLRLQRGK